MKRKPFYLEWNDYVQLYKLAVARNRSREDYFSFEAYQGGMLVRYLRSQGLSLSGLSLLDLGGGFGGYMEAFKAEGANVVGLDIRPPKVDSVAVIAADALRIPAAGGSFDLVVCASLIEHLPDPAALLMEIWRVLKEGGLLYLSFPPYYFITGGHQFSPYHLFGQKFALYVARKKGLFRGQKWLESMYPTRPSSFDTAFGSWGLYRMTIAKTRRLLKNLPYTVVDRSTRWLPFDFSAIPVLGEFMTWHVQFLLKKE